MADFADLPIVDGGQMAIVLQTPEDHEKADVLYRKFRDLEKRTAADQLYLRARKRLQDAQDKIRVPLHVLNSARVLISNAISNWRKAEAEKVAQAAAEAAEKAGASEVETASAVSKILQQQADDRKEAGQARTQTYWHAEVENLGMLAATIVAGDEDLFEAAKLLRRSKVGRVSPDVLVGLRHMKTDLVPVKHLTSPGLNELARAQEKNLTVPGVKAVSAEGVASR